jgi:RepB DNA-primase from phage plasmid
VKAPIPQDDALRLQLAMLSGNEPASSYLELRPLDREGKPSQRAFLPARDISGAMAQIKSLASHLNVFIGAAPRVRQEGTAAAIERVWALWVDCDSQAAVTALRGFRPLPTVVICSGTGENMHGWWALRQPIRPEWARRANRRLALALGADPAATDPARIMRPAGTLNFKHDPPAAVVCVRVELDVFLMRDVVGSLADSPEYVRSERPSTPPLPGGLPALDSLARVVRDAETGNRNNALFWAAARAREHVNAGTLAEGQVREALRDAALATGLGEIEVERTLSSGLDMRAAA